jgi:hemerythrin-like metal-binding protein
LTSSAILCHHIPIYLFVRKEEPPVVAIITWKSCYETGNATFDAEHRALVNALNDLHVAMREKRGDEVLLPLLTTLNTYIRKHFQHEEETMLRYRYPGMEAHIKAHGSFKNTVKDFQEQVLTGYSGLSPELYKYLRDWLLNHIVKTDSQFGNFLREKNIYTCGPPVL